jgi:hypothetical protein
LNLDSPTYNATSIVIVLGGVLWFPLLFCKDPDYIKPLVNHRDEIVSTGGPPTVPRTYRVNNDETDNELPSYYEMTSPPAYKTKTTTIVTESSPSLC